MIEEWTRLRDFGLRIHQERQLVVQDVERLQQKFTIACENHRKATLYLRQLAECRNDPASPSEVCEIDGLLWDHSQKRALYLQAAKRIYGILRLNELFQLMLGEMADQIHHALHSSLDIARALADGRRPEKHLEAEFAQACGRLLSYRKLYEQVRPPGGLE